MDATSNITIKGQITIPVAMRDHLGLRPGQKVRFRQTKKSIVVTPVLDEVKAAFGLVKAKRGVSLKEMEKTIRKARHENSR